MTTTINIGSLISSSPEICGGKTCIAGTRVPIMNIVIDYKSGQTPEEIAQERSHLNLAQIYAALAFYHANKQAIDKEITNYYAECSWWEEEAKADRI
jgi:uncharacterized protein (DUF433 family)